MQSLRDDGVLIPCRVAGLNWDTVAAVLDSRFASGAMGRHELAKAREHYAKLTIENAQRLLRFWQVRSTAAPPEDELRELSLSVIASEVRSDADRRGATIVARGRTPDSLRRCRFARGMTE